MKTAEFFDLIEEFFGPRAEATDSSGAEFTGILYETFAVRCALGGDHGEFGASIETASGARLNTFFGQRLSLNDDRDSILSSLKTIDEWCRLHLPDEFLDRYETALGISSLSRRDQDREFRRSSSFLNGWAASPE
ncbi:hypothetical protein [Mesorhizobium japonicum]|uniref:hypothetical protein n=1 Tax=Mesorhizobium japonicum TaxID=2066070 RepID=UPI003B5AE111